MSRQIVIEFPPGQDINRVRNFGEALYDAFRDNGWATISFDEIDRATTQLHLTVNATRRIGQVTTIVKRLLRRHNFEGVARLRNQ